MPRSPAPPSGPPPERRSITVPGHGAVLVEPDVAGLRLGVVVVRPTATQARQAAAATMEAVLAALGSGGVARADLRTTMVGLDAVRDYGAGTVPTVTGYQLTNVVDVTVRSVEAVGGLIDGALAAGATSLDGLGFGLADPTHAVADARRRAVADARARAGTLATEAGVELGPVVAIVEGGEPTGPPQPMAELRMKAMADVATPVEAGTTEIAVDIVVTFAIA